MESGAPVQFPEVNSMGEKIPSNYQEWIDCLKQMQKSGRLPFDMSMLERGRMACDGGTLGRFETHLTETVNIMLNREIGRFIRNLNEVLEFGEFDSLPFLVRRFQGQIQSCLFFQNIGFLPVSFREELGTETRRQVMRVWEGLIQRLLQIQEETKDPELEDALYGIRRVKLFGEEREHGELRYDKTGS